MRSETVETERDTQAVVERDLSFPACLLLSVAAFAAGATIFLICAMV